MTFYYPEKLFDVNKRWHIFPLLKSLLKEESYQYANFDLTDDITNADCVILPMSWNYYYTHDLLENVLKFSNSIMDKKILSFVFGDIGVKVPNDFKGLIYRMSGLKSKLSYNHKGMPVFIDDPIIKHFIGKDSITKKKSKVATVGFCGQAIPFNIKSSKALLSIALNNFKSFIGLSKRDPDTLISSSFLRYKLLMRLERSSKVNSNFIYRKAYRAGVKNDKDIDPTTLEFYNNIKDSDYVICVRGGGNFSTRFYETLAMGRIPVFVNTDCLLPLQDVINWKHHIVWVDFNERHLIAEKIAEFHAKHNEDSLNQLFLANRKLWENHLQLYQFFNASLNEF